MVISPETKSLHPAVHQPEESVAQRSAAAAASAQSLRRAPHSPQPVKRWHKLFGRPQETYIAILSAAGILLYFVLRYAASLQTSATLIPLYATLLIGGVPLVVALARKLIARQFGSDLLAGVSILSSVVLGQYLVGSIIVLMLSGCAAVQQYATRGASSVLA